jgi:hypothetical protein
MNAYLVVDDSLRLVPEGANLARNPCGPPAHGSNLLLSAHLKGMAISRCDDRSRHLMHYASKHG